MANLINETGKGPRLVIKNLQDLMKHVNDAETVSEVPDINISDFPSGEREAAAVIINLLHDRRELQDMNRQRMAALMADADALLESLVRIGLGDFTNPVAEVNFKGLKNIRIGIEDMQQQLRRSHEELSKLIIVLKHSEERFRQLVESTSDWIWEMDKNGKYRYASPQVEPILGYKPEEVLGRTPFEMMPCVEAEKMKATLEALINSGQPINQLQNVNEHKDGHQVVLESSARPFFDDEGVIQGYRGVDRDVTERKRMEEKLRHLATHDSLTGLHNRKVFQERIQDELERSERYGHPLAMFMLDIDLFKQVNDSYGHAAGDDVLRAFSVVLKETVRKTDFVARYGGEEFTALLPETSLEEAAVFAERLREAIAEYPFELKNGRKLQIKTSIGVACYPIHADDWQGLLNAADKALYFAKWSGRNRVETVPESRRG